MSHLVDETCISILGAGNGGHAFAAFVKDRGFRVKIWNRSNQKIKAIKKNRGITSQGLLEGHFSVDLATTSIKDVLKDSKLIMVVTSADAHKELAMKISRYLNKDQVIVLNPGRTCGALEVNHTIRDYCGSCKPQIAEAQSLLFVARSPQPAFVTIAGVKSKLPVATFPSTNLQECLPLLKNINDSFCEAETVLHTSFNNIGSIFHPAPLLLNAARCESEGVTYRHYIDGITPTIAEFLEKMDQERVKVASAYGIPAISLNKWLKIVYGSKGKTLYEKIQRTEQYSNVEAPSTLNCRYIFEDVPTGLVPISNLGAAIGVTTPHIDVIINLANCMMKTNYSETGRTIDSMGLTNIPTHLLKDYVTFGEEALLGISEEEVVLEE
ncbi:MAG: NAD/NADP octopine/nopaline dehydrogenase family protein [Candidatus Heimdallarchaeota archaeon]|nr:MAG: NAD/NADP octopine/nopaline dehydrogenase family protein [Candidatus Heimdallarchaeota archaeon]